MIQIRNLSKSYDTLNGRVQALQDISLDIPERSIFGIIGSSGAGKSTLVRCLNMLEKPTEGKVLISEQDISTLSKTELRQKRQKISMIFQHFNLLQSRTVSGNIGFPLEIAGWDKTAIRKRVSELLPLVGLEDKADSYPSELSGGQKQRVGIARALATKPEVLLCDEATSALDPKTTSSILSILKDINQNLGLTIVIITHEMNVIKDICTHVAVLAESKCIEHGTVEEVFISPKTQVTKDFVADIFRTELPDDILSALKPHKDSELIKVSFYGNSASEPMINGLIKSSDVVVNIIYGNVDHLHGTLFGNLLLELRGTEEQLANAHQYFTDNNLVIQRI
ncbi:ABC transporter related protein [Denitrovibrio acetiphilus DSM 12809]|uniref:Cell division ATP-binding protein FtsE n=1 Tax=Denitrovibrio acetiphilus (strain DSM 12809 / NBRC 114555 / N2460) TaxID=522772 RepID=D4H253_DENA2|nr:ATP-binding cassette domain-containing protein [Denitrovibrio acetiphilus]ADD68844.1 ABC transporter related protein [Denitrovibrio acetiphilus DSM 12809]